MEISQPKGKYDILNFPGLNILHLVDDILLKFIF